MDQETTDCLSENELLAWVDGRLASERVRILDRHVDTCDHCQALLGEALRGTRETAEPRHAQGETFTAGALVAERYRVVRFLARGGMGEVYEVEDQWLHQTVALKTLLASIADDATALARLKAEVLLARRISHPNVCRVFDFGFTERRASGAGAHAERVAFLTMELLHGETLKAHVRRAGRLNVDEARPLVAQIIAGLSHAHAAGIVHRDFKSDNVMLVSEGEPKRSRLVITDFGLARSLLFAHQSLTSSQHALGTLDYMAPEQLEGDPPTPQSDIYAVGVVLFEMLTGRLPFPGTSAIARTLRRARAEAPRIGTRLPDADPTWERIIARCLARDLRERCTNLEELLPLVEAPAVAGHGRSRIRPRLWIWLAAGLTLGTGAAVTFHALIANRDGGRSSPTIPETREVSIKKPVSRPSVAPDPAPVTAPEVGPIAAPIPKTPARRTAPRGAPSPSPRAPQRAAAAGDGLLNPFTR